MTTQHDPGSAAPAGQQRSDTDPTQSPLSDSRRETRGLVGVVAATVVLCLLTTMAFNVVVTRSLHGPYAVPDTRLARGAVTAPAPPQQPHLQSPASAITALPMRSLPRRKRPQTTALITWPTLLRLVQAPVPWRKSLCRPMRGKFQTRRWAQ